MTVVAEEWGRGVGGCGGNSSGGGGTKWLDRVICNTASEKRRAGDQDQDQDQVPVPAFSFY